MKGDFFRIKKHLEIFFARCVKGRHLSCELDYKNRMERVIGMSIRKRRVEMGQVLIFSLILLGVLSTYGGAFAADVGRERAVDEALEKAIIQAQKTMREDLGGPFGAAIIDVDGTVLCVASNTVLGDHDPTAHAEINAIRLAAEIKGTHDLSGMVIYATGYPCPMCLAAIIWANITEAVYGCRPEDAEEIGFRDDFIYRFIESGRSDSLILSIEEYGRDRCLELFDEYAELNKIIY